MSTRRAKEARKSVAKSPGPMKGPLLPDATVPQQSTRPPSLSRSRLFRRYCLLRRGRVLFHFSQRGPAYEKASEGHFSRWIRYSPHLFSYFSRRVPRVLYKLARRRKICKAAKIRWSLKSHCTRPSVPKTSFSSPSLAAARRLAHWGRSRSFTHPNGHIS